MLNWHRKPCLLILKPACCVRFWLLPGQGRGRLVDCPSVHSPLSLLRFWLRAQCISSLNRRGNFKNRERSTELIHYRTGSLGTFFRPHKIIKRSTCNKLFSNERAVSLTGPITKKGCPISHLRGPKERETNCVNNHRPASPHMGRRQKKRGSNPLPSPNIFNADRSFFFFGEQGKPRE